MDETNGLSGNDHFEPADGVAEPRRLDRRTAASPRDWWTKRRRRYELFVSVLVVTEVERGDPTAAKERLAKLGACRILPYPPDAEALTRALLASRLIPAKAETDAAHVAIAAVHGMDFLLTWNCRHKANATIVEKLRGVCADEGFPAPVICTPHELMV
ncbi:MAG: type II toxin-antitoxin system VapC family toxin [Verrucomicrobia bacterium]|nr:type II toxin-antitoxin system VapC family toxin [Verrucomicrobiota bacterium]